MNRLCILLVCFVTQIIAIPFGNLYFEGQMSSPPWVGKSQFYWPDPLRIFQQHHENLMRLLGWKSEQFPIQQRFANPQFGPFQQSFAPTTFRPPPNFVLPPINPEENEIYRAPIPPYYQNPALPPPGLPPPSLNYLPSTAFPVAPYPAAPYPPAGVPFAGPSVLPITTNGPLPSPGPVINFASTSPSNSLIHESSTGTMVEQNANIVSTPPKPSLPAETAAPPPQIALPLDPNAPKVPLVSTTEAYLLVQPAGVPNRISEGESEAAVSSTEASVPLEVAPVTPQSVLASPSLQPSAAILNSPIEPESTQSPTTENTESTTLAETTTALLAP